MERTDRKIRARELRRSSTEVEAVLWQRLRDRRVARWKWRRQDPIGPYFADFACREARLVVELDGAHHNEPDAVEYDEERSVFMEAKGWRVIRFSNQEVLYETDKVLNAILQALRPSP